MGASTRGFFFDSGGARLYGYLHGAVEPARDTAVVLVHAFMEERQDSHAVVRDLAARLAERGFAALRFDLYGCGDSEGDWSDGTLERWRDDVCAAARWLREATGVARVVLVGFRFGAALAGLAARSLDVAGVALVQPVVRGEAYVMEILLANLAAEMVLNRRVGITREGLIAQLEAGGAVNLFGYHLTSAQYRGIRGIDLARDLAGDGPPTLVVDVARTPTAREPREHLNLVAALGERGVATRAVEPYALFNEGKVHVARADEVCRAVLAWMER